MITIIPATLERIIWFSLKSVPIVVLAAPRRTKTIEKPKPKKIAPKSALSLKSFGLFSSLSIFLSVSRLSPVIKEIYPGIRGKIQGDRNERSPARKAAAIEGVL